MSQALLIVRYYALRASVLLSIWGLQHIFSRRRKKQPRKQEVLPVPAENCFKIITKHQPHNPVWLQEALALDEATLLADPTWQCPLLTDFQTGLKSGGLRIPFGEACRRELFCLDPSAVYLNHGSYGAAVKLSLQVQQWYQQQLEQQPVRFMETVAVKGVLAAVSKVAELLHCSPRDVVPAVNATGAIQAVLNGLRLQRGDFVLLTSTTYPAVRSMVARAASDVGAKVLLVQVSMQHMQQPHTLLAAFQTALSAGRGRVRLAIVDHIVSFPPIVLPVQQLAALCRKAGSKVLIDGAHAIGALPNLRVEALGAHYYTSNVHKWCCCPKGAAVLWVTPAEQASVRPLVTSHGCGLGFRGDWIWQGTQDRSAWLAVPAALAVLQALGWERVARHNHRCVNVVLMQPDATLQQQHNSQASAQVRSERQARQRAALEELLAFVIRCVNDKRDHIPPVVSSSTITFPFDITVSGAARSSSFGLHAMKKMLMQTAPPPILS